MPVFAHPEFDGHQEVVFGHESESGLNAIIAIHNTNRGPALGGCRMWPYASEAEALTDVLRLSRGMTYKSALADLPLGGGKAVIIGDPHTDKSEALFLAMGRFVDSLGGRYISAEDVGVSVEDVDIMARVTKHVAGTCTAGAGDPSPATAYGVLVGIRAAVAHKLGRNSLDGLRVAIQGVGHVGYYLCRQLAEAGAKLVVTDIDREAVRRVETEFHAQPVAPDEIYGVDGEVFAPCALGAVINDETIAQLKASIVAG
jgi:leucine dehydrogenase